MKAVALVQKGLEDISAAELIELSCTNIQTFDSIIEFETKNLLQLCKICYKAQSLIKVMPLLFKFPVSENLEDTQKAFLSKFSKEALSEYITSVEYKAETIRSGVHGFSSQDISRFVTEQVSKTFTLNPQYKNPNTIFLTLIVNKDGYLGVDLSGFELNKRDYKIFNNPASIKGNVAFSLARLAGLSHASIILDPLCKSGEVCIESALYTIKKSVNFHRKDTFAFTRLHSFKGENFDAFFDNIDKNIVKPAAQIFAFDNSMQNLKAAEKNAKIAGVKEAIKFSRLSLEWLDTKFEKEQLGSIATYLPSPSQKIAKNTAQKLYKELFNQAEYILDKKGKMALLIRDSSALKEVIPKTLTQLEERSTWFGKDELKILVLGRAV